ncbi:MAG: sigma-54 dependent transcriptional regulator [Lentisphaeraceae bacterium]|nr:sigma-54 dependent transcriptional regulator [Lentisphaeraceae bacterium]
MINILIVEESTELKDTVNASFKSAVNVTSIKSIAYILDLFTDKTFDILIWKTEVAKKNAANAIELLEVISAQSPKTQIIIIAPESDSDLAIEGIAAGAFQYLLSPIKKTELFSLIDIAVQQQPQVGHNTLLEEDGLVNLHALYGISPQIRSVYRQIKEAAGAEISVLVTGETGTGKDLVAEAIHKCSHRSDNPFIRVNTGAIPNELIASELFGHTKGAFTGAVESRSGRFENADKGSIFLDEIGTMDNNTQVYLLRLLENNTFHKVGGKKEIKVDVRVIAATNEDLFQALKEGRFREDLYYRFDVYRIDIPPLKEREGDVKFLTDYFITFFSRKVQKNIIRISNKAMKCLELYDWPGNVRELKNTIQRAVLLSRSGEIKEKDLPLRIREKYKELKSRDQYYVGMTLAEVEKKFIEKTLVQYPNKSECARVLGMSRKSLYNKLQKYSIGDKRLN